MSVYAATKAFDRFLALGIAEEVARFGVKVTALCPGTTESEFFEVARASQFRSRKLQSAAEVARLAITALARGQRTLLPKASGRRMAFLVRFLPTNLVTRFVEKAARPKS
jgi:short-subunit dehydrogenase